MEDALGRVKPLVLNAQAVEAVLVPRSEARAQARVLAGRDRERQRRPPPTLRAVDKAAAREHHPEWCSALPRNGLGL